MADGEVTGPGNAKSVEICDLGSSLMRVEFQEDQSGSYVQNEL